MKALIIEDSKIIANLHKNILKEINVNADIAYDGEEGLNIIKNNYNDYDIIFTDYNMPNMDGRDLLRKLKQLDYFNIPVVLVSSEINNIPFSNNINFDAYLNKPLNKEKALEIINKLLNN